MSPGTYDGTTCSAVGAFTTIATNPVSPYVDTALSRESCYNTDHSATTMKGSTTTRPTTKAVAMVRSLR